VDEIYEKRNSNIATNPNKKIFGHTYIIEKV
jgi:hypothetical protein